MKKFIIVLSILFGFCFNSIAGIFPQTEESNSLFNPDTINVSTVETTNKESTNQVPVTSGILILSALGGAYFAIKNKHKTN